MPGYQQKSSHKQIEAHKQKNVNTSLVKTQFSCNTALSCCLKMRLVRFLYVCVKNVGHIADDPEHLHKYLFGF